MNALGLVAITWILLAPPDQGLSCSIQAQPKPAVPEAKPVAAGPSANVRNSPEAPKTAQERAAETLDFLIGAAGQLADVERRAITQASLGSAISLKDRKQGLELLKQAFLSVDARLHSDQKRAMDARTQELEHARLEKLKSDILRRISMIDGAVGLRLELETRKPSQDSAPKGPVPAFAARQGQAQAMMAAAYEALERDPLQAAEIARQSLSFGIAPWMTDFLLRLRLRQPAAADRVYESAFSMAVAFNPPSVDDLLVLTGFVFPGFFGLTRATDVPNTLRAQRFLGAIADGLRGIALAGGGGTQPGSLQAMRSVLAVQRMIPLYQTYRPDLLGGVTAMLERAGRTVSDGLRPKFDAGESGGADVAGASLGLLNAAETAPNAEARDMLLGQAAQTFAEQGELEKARQAALGISGAAIRERTLEEAAVTATQATLSAGNIDRARIYARQIQQVKPHIEQLILIANRYAQDGDRDRAAMVLSEAGNLVRGLEAGLDKIELGFSLASASLQADPARAADLFQSAVNSINRLSQGVKPAEGSGAGTEWAKSRIDTGVRGALEAGFAQWARTDFDDALLISGGLAAPEYRILAQAAACRTVMAASAQAEKSYTDVKPAFRGGSGASKGKNPRKRPESD